MQSLDPLCHASIVPAPTRRSTVAPAYAYGTEHQLRAYATWQLGRAFLP